MELILLIQQTVLLVLIALMDNSSLAVFVMELRPPIHKLVPLVPLVTRVSLLEPTVMELLPVTLAFVSHAATVVLLIPAPQALNLPELLAPELEVQTHKPALKPEIPCVIYTVVV
jgi:hypothetical protein